MINIGLNGFGRIGRAILRNSMSFDDIQIVAINDINPEIENLHYLLKYDSYYGRFNKKIKIEDNKIVIDSKKIHIYQKNKIGDVPWIDHQCDIVIEAAGVHSLLDDLPKIISSGVKKVLVTYSPQEKVDQYLVLGANEQNYNSDKDHIVSSSICDVVALAPVYKIVDDNFTIQNGFLTTLHPWLSYQNVLDGPPQSWGYPGSLYGHYSLGRASTASLILKPTTAITAADKIIPGIINNMKCYSYRVPTAVVGSADITFQTQKNISKDMIIELFQSKINKQKWPILYLNNDPLVSIDFRGTDYSAILDIRWCEVLDGNLVKMTLWYDNEYGYSRRVVDLSRYLFDLEPKLNLNEETTLS